MKILMIINSFYPLVGGAEKQAERLSISLLESRNVKNVSVLTRHYKNLSKHENINGINVVRLKSFGPSKLKPITFLVSCFIYLVKNHKKFDLFHAHSLSFGGYAVTLFGKIFNKPSISKIAGGGGRYGSEPMNMFHGNFFKKMRLNYIKKNISKVIAISNLINEDLKTIGYPLHKIQRINNGIDTNKNYEKIQWVKELSSEYGVFLYAGRFEKIKGIDILISAWNKTSKDFREKNRLLIIGKGSIDVKSFLNDSSIVFIGPVENVESYLIKGNTFILPSRYEGISNSLLEAMKNKNLIICSDAGGNTDLIKNNINGLIFETENIEDLYKKILISANMKENKKNEYIDNGYIHLVNSYSFNKVTEQYNNLYKKLL